MQGWWPNLLQGAVSAVIGGVVAALTAWAVVAASRRHERRLHLEREARDAAFKLLFQLGDIRVKLASSCSPDATLPAITTDNVVWGLPVFATEVAMFSLAQRVGAPFSQAIGRLRRRLETVEGMASPPATKVDEAISACDEVSEFLADWLMRGQHRRRAARRPQTSGSRGYGGAS